MAETIATFLDFEGAKIWIHYKRSRCVKILRCDGGSTKGLHVHLKSIHKIDLIKRKFGE